MSNLVPLTTRVVAPCAILASGLILMMGAPTDTVVTAVRVLAGVVVLPIGLVLASAIVQTWWVRRHNGASGPGERSSIL